MTFLSKFSSPIKRKTNQNVKKKKNLKKVKGGCDKVWKIQFLPHNKQTARYAHNNVLKQQKNLSPRDLCDTVPSHVCDLLICFVDYIAEVVKLASCEPETRVCETLLALCRVLAILATDVLTLFKYYCHSLRRNFRK